MKSKMTPFVVLAVVVLALLTAGSCSNGSAVCPTCGTTSNGTVGLIGVMLVPEHNGNGEPGGPFNIFDISWVDSVNHFYYVSDRIGLDVPMFSTQTDIAVLPIEGDNGVPENGNFASSCWADPTSGTTIPPITTAFGNYTRFGCKTGGFRLPGFFGPNGHFGGYVGGQCCASRANNLNPLSGPNGIEVSPDGTKLYTGNGSANVVVYDLTQTLASGGTTQPTVIADLVTGSSPDYDGTVGIGPCQASANGRAFSDPTCGDLRGDELATTGANVAVDGLGNKHNLLMVINGDPGLPFTTLFDITNILNPQPEGPDTSPATFQSNHCLPVSFGPPGPYAPVGVNVQNPYSPGGGNQSGIGGGGVSDPNTFFTKNYPSCVLGQIYYDGASQNNQNVVVDDIGLNGPSGPPESATAFPCPDPSLQFLGTVPGSPGLAVPSGISGHASFGGNVSVSGADVPCHHGPIIDINTGIYDPTCNPTLAGAICQGAIAPAGLGAMVYYPQTGMFLLTNGNSTANIAVGSVDVINPFFVFEGGPPAGIPVVVNSFPTPSCMPGAITLGPGTDVLVLCAGHDGRQFAPATIIMNGTTGQILATINNVGGVDEGWYNPGDQRYYLAARDMPTGPVLGVIDALHRQWLQNVPTNGNAHSVAADAVFNKIYVPLPSGGNNCQTQQIDGCVGVYARQ